MRNRQNLLRNKSLTFWGHLKMLIPYALFATFEMAPDCGVEVYQKVVTKVQTKNAIKTM